MATTRQRGDQVAKRLVASIINSEMDDGPHEMDGGPHIQIKKALKRTGMGWHFDIEHEGYGPAIFWEGHYDWTREAKMRTWNQIVARSGWEVMKLDEWAVVLVKVAQGGN